MVTPCRTYLEFKDYYEHIKYKVAFSKLTKFASLWFDNIQKQRRMARKENSKTWQKLKKHLKRRFFPSGYVSFATLRQKESFKVQRNKGYEYGRNHSVCA